MTGDLVVNVTRVIDLDPGRRPRRGDHHRLAGPPAARHRTAPAAWPSRSRSACPPPRGSSGCCPERHRPWMNLGSLVVMGAAGGALAGLSPSSPAVAVGCAACFSAGVRLKTEVSLAVMAETVAAFLIAALVTGAPTGALLGFPFAYAGLVERGPDPPRVPGPGRASRAHAGRDPPRPARPRRTRPRWPSGPGSPVTSTTCSPTRWPRCRSTCRPPRGCWPRTRCPRTTPSSPRRSSASTGPAR